MGVLYHRRDPQEHLNELYSALRPGGQLVLDTLINPHSGLDSAIARSTLCTDAYCLVLARHRHLVPLAQYRRIRRD